MRSSLWLTPILTMVVYHRLLHFAIVFWNYFPAARNCADFLILSGRGSLDNFTALDYNKNTRRCLLRTSTSPWRNPDGCHNIELSGWALSAQNREPSVAADGSLLFIVLLIVQIKHERHNAANGTDGSENGQKCRSYMYRLPGIDFPWKLHTRLHSAFTGWQATVFYRTPSAKEEKLDMDGGISRNPLYR